MKPDLDRLEKLHGCLCPYCNGAGVAPGHDVFACWMCEGSGRVCPREPTSRGLFIDWLIDRTAEARAAGRMREAIEHVINDSPGTPESVKEYLRRKLAGEEPGGHFETAHTQTFDWPPREALAAGGAEGEA